VADNETKKAVFLTAEWSNLLMFNYAVDPAMLRSFVPPGTELDAFEGTTYVSLIGFEFNRTRVHGVRIPFHQSFEEVNLRFYVKRASKRGVVFIRELVPKYAVAAIARTAFGENYSMVTMSHRRQTDADDTIKVEYAWGTGEQRCSLYLETEGPGLLPLEGSESQFIAEHYWGYSKTRGGGCLEYEVEHPCWHVRKAKHVSARGNFSAFYGGEFGKVFSRNPDSAFFAKGSAVTVMSGKEIL